MVSFYLILADGFSRRQVHEFLGNISRRLNISEADSEAMVYQVGEKC